MEIIGGRKEERAAKMSENQMRVRHDPDSGIPIFVDKGGGY